MSIRNRQTVVVALSLAALVFATAAMASSVRDVVLVVYWTVGASVVGSCLVAFLVGRRFTHLPPAEGRVLCIVPVYNEPVTILERTVAALRAQTVPMDIVVLDDGSATPVTPTAYGPRIHWWRHANTGKRGAQVEALRRVRQEEYDFILTVDSDSQPDPDACEHLLRAMSDPRVQAATGMIYVRHFADSWTSMASDIDIGTSCVMMRASRSMLGALETTSGALALYRSSLLYDHLDAYAVECGTGDDRWLALRALRRGDMVAVAEARVRTEMPTTVRGVYRQRLRWARSWWWMLPYVFANLGPRQVLSPLLGIIQLAISPVLLLYTIGNIAYAVSSSDTHRVSELFYVYLAVYLFVRYALCALYLIGRPNVSIRGKLALFLVGTPAAILLNVVFLTPIRYWALFKIFDNRWQTREVDPNAFQVDLAAVAE
jgi:hyaluronan synthase